jgi:hypothetical protein
MKTLSWARGSFSPERAALVFLLALPLAAQGLVEPWLPAGPPKAVEYRFETTNGITVFHLSGQLAGGYCCQRIAGYAVQRDGSRLTQVIQEETWGEACIMMMCPPWREEVVSILGALAPGDYTLALFAQSLFAPFPSQWASVSFTVPGELRPALAIGKSPHLASTSLLIQVTGVTNATCVLEASTNMHDWTAVQTNSNSGAPMNFSVPGTEGHRFYRAVIPKP